MHIFCNYIIYVIFIFYFSLNFDTFQVNKIMIKICVRLILQN